MQSIRKEIRSKGMNLAQVLREAGVPLDMRCDGRGTCGRCRVRLLSGEWLVGDAEVSAPAEALACRAQLRSESGLVEIDAADLLPSNNGIVLDGWQNTRDLPVSKDVVVGIDIGTTTLSAAAFCCGRVLARSSRYNPQGRFGDNVMSRISASEKHLWEMRDLLLAALREMLRELPTPSRMAIAGNSTMTCIFHGVSPMSMGRAPFTLPQADFEPVSGESLGLPADIPIYTVPLAGAFLGGDILGGMHEAQLAPGDLFVDIGTNCEMVFQEQDGAYVGAAAAAGPAFEGAGIACGSRAVNGAICAYRGANDFDVIGGGLPSGICGSAMVDFLAVEFRAGRINKFGRYVPQAQARELADGLSISEADIEQLLKAKAAVAAGIASLEEYCHAPCRRLVLAGGFAQFVNLQNAQEIGLLPKRECVLVGNTSLASALRLAANPDSIAELTRIRASLTQIHLNEIASFEKHFINGLMLAR